MRIDKLNISEFGGLKDKQFSLRDGINVFEGYNESGKSTVVSFIRFMLYGMPKKTAAAGISDRDRYMSWSGHTSAGSMEITTNDGSYRIERKYVLTTASSKDAIDECRIIDKKTGSEVFKDAIPGKIFLGITADVYDSTSCIKQLECSNVDGNSVRTSIENLLLSADEKVDTKKAQGKLDTLRKALLHKSGKGGQIFELENKLSFLKEKLDKAKVDAEVVIQKENIVSKMSQLEISSAKNERELERTIEIYEACTILKQFDLLHKEENEASEIKNSLSELTSKRGFFCKLPDRSVITELENRERAVILANDKMLSAKAELENADNSPCGDRRLAAIHQKIADIGHGSVISQTQRSLKKQKTASVFSVFMYIAGVILVLVGILGIAGPFIPFDISFVTKKLPESLLPFIFYALLCAGMLSTLLGVICTSSASKHRKKRLSLFSTCGLITKVGTPNELEAHMTICKKNFELCQNHDSVYDAAHSKLLTATDNLKKEIGLTKETLASVNKNISTDNVQDITELLDKLRKEFSDVCSVKEALEARLSAKQSTASSMQNALAQYNEDELRSSIPPTADIYQILEDTDIADVKKKHEFYKLQHAATMQKRINTEKELVALKASMGESPARLESDTDMTERELTICKKNYNALIMAINAIDTASDNIRRNVTPDIKNRASRLMGILTSEKYTELGLSPDLDINVRVALDDTKSIDALSKGTRDAAYIALRLALVDIICGDNPPPIIFDESLSLIDDIRTKQMLSQLYAYTGNGGQCLIFTCHKRETQILRSIGDFNHIIL